MPQIEEFRFFFLGYYCVLLKLIVSHVESAGEAKKEVIIVAIC